MILYLKGVNKSTIIDKIHKTLCDGGVKKSTIMDDKSTIIDKIHKTLCDGGVKKSTIMDEMQKKHYVSTI